MNTPTSGINRRSPHPGLSVTVYRVTPGTLERTFVSTTSAAPNEEPEQVRNWPGCSCPLHRQPPEPLVSPLCFRCGARPAPIVVGIVSTGSGPGGTTHACQICVEDGGVIPMSEWTDPGDGRPQYHPSGEPRRA